MGNVWKYILIAAFLIVLVYLSTLLKVEPKSKCYGFSGLIKNPAGADEAAFGFCGSIIWEKNQPIFRIGTNQRTSFCLKSIPLVQKACGQSFDEVMLEDELYDYDYYFKCHYIILNNSNGRQKDIVTITNYFDYVGEAYKNIIITSEWHSVYSDLSYGICKNLKEQIKL